MRRALVPGALAGAGLCVLAVALASRMDPEPPPPAPAPVPEEFRVEARLDLVEDDGTFAFRVSGRTNLPHGTVLRARAFAVDRSASGPGEEDEEPLVWEDDETQPAVARLSTRGGRFSGEVCRFPRRPYSIPYRVRIEVRRDEQPPDLRPLLGDEEASGLAELRPADRAAFRSEILERRAEAGRDLDELEALFRDLRRELDRQRAAPDPDGWRFLEGAWRGRVAVLLRRNEERFELWCVFEERRAKMRLKGGGDCLLRTIEDAGAFLAGQGDRDGRLRERMAALGDFLEEARDEGGYGGGMDPEVFGPLLSAYEEAVARLPAARREALEGLLRLAPPLVRRKRAYAALSDVGFGLARLLDAPGPEAWDTHDRALAEFRSLAGLD